MPSDRFAWNDPVRLSFTDRGNSSQARQTPPVGRSENLTGSSFLLQWSSATNPCIFCLYYSSKEGEGKEIRKPLFHSVPVFQIKISFPCSDNGSLRCSCSGTIGALASVVLLFLNDRPVVSERSEFQMTDRSDRVSEHEHRRRISNRTNLHYLRPSSRQYTSLRITSSTFSLLLTSRPYSSTCTVPPIETAGLR